MSIRYGKLHVVNGSTDTTLHPVTDDSVVQVTSTNENIPSGTDTAEDLFNALGSLAFANSISIPEGTTSAKGVVQLSNTTNDTTDESNAATVKAVSNVNANAVHTTGTESIGGTKTFTAGTVIVGGAQLEYDSVQNTLTIGVPATS